jgi:hypothetical protein
LAALALALAWLAGPVDAATVNAGTETAVSLSVPAPMESFTIGIIGDRTAGPETGLAVLKQAVQELNLVRPAFVIHIGDLVPGYIRDMGRWQADIERVKAILADLEAPLFPVAGNHDVITGTGNADDRRGEELYKRHFGPLYYSFDYGPVHFVCLYTDEAMQSVPKLSDRQLQWLREDLAACTARDIFVLMHKPVWEYAGAGWETVEEMFKGHPVKAVIAGHFHHYYRSQNRNGVQYYVIGPTGGQLFSPELAGGLEHYCLLSVRPDGYRLALVRPGNILPDDYITTDDFKNAEKLRSLSHDEAGVISMVRSPEQGGTDEPVTVVVSNPLARPLPVTVRGVAHGGWSFSPPARTLLLAAGARQEVYLGVRCAQVSSERLTVPEVEIQYSYVDSKDRDVPIVLTRRVPLRRAVTAAMARPAIVLDARDDEEPWKGAPLLTTECWEESPFETGEAGPTFRILAAPAGLYFYAESPDAVVSDFRGDRMLSDAIFVGLMSPERAAGAADLVNVPVVVVFPFSPSGQGQAVQAFWDAKKVAGPAARGVQVASRVLEKGKGWACEGFVPWDALLADGTQPGTEVQFNMGAWDNDGDMFTELHTWAPTASASQWGRLTIQPAAEK